MSWFASIASRISLVKPYQEVWPLDVEVFGLPVVLWGKQIGILALYHDIAAFTPAVPAGLPVAEAVLVDRLMSGSTDTAEPLPEDLLEELTRTEPLLEEKWAPIPEETPAIVEAALLDEVEAEAPMETEAEESVPEQVKSRRRAVRVESIEGIGSVYAAKLGEYNIVTTDELLTAGATRKGRQELIEKTGLSPKIIMRWVNIADLMRVPGIGEQYSELLEAAGVDTVKELRNRNPRNLQLAMQTVNQEKKLVRRAPYLSEVEAWVQAAKELEGILEY